MPTVRKLERAKHNCNRVGRSGGRCLNTSRSLFVLVVSFAAWGYFSETAAERPSGAILEAGTLATMELTRASVPAAKVADTTRASSTQWCRHFQQA